MRILFFINILLLAHHVSALKVLAIISMPLRSHYMAFQNLFRGLAEKGHSVTFINNYPNDRPLPNLRSINLQVGKQPIANVTNIEQRNSISVQWYEERRAEFLHIRNFFHHLDYSMEVVEAECFNLLTNRYAKQHLEENIKYDVIFVEQFVSDCGLMYAAALYDAPIIGITSHTLMPWSYERLGIPFNIATDSFYFSNAGTSPSLYHKVETALMKVLFNTVGRWYIQNVVYDVYKKYLPNVSLDIERVARERMKMIFSYQHFSITGARLEAPQLLEIAGIHVPEPQPVSTEIEEFLSDAKHGAIYVSFGSNLKSSTMSQEMMNRFLGAFAQLPQKFILKWENNTLPPGYDNVLAQKWFDQVDILCHPKVVGFITHGGMLSLSESVHCGKPLLVMPFFADQFSNAAAIKASGLGDMMFFSQVTTEKLVKSLKMLTSPETQQNAQRISKLFHDRPLPVLENAIYWTEYVARHRISPPSLPTKHTTWYENLLLDVVVVIVLFIIFIAWISYTICKFLLNKIHKFLENGVNGKKVKGE